ncbi:MAG: hypothetical protein LC131_11750 [Anaerolineae bacterium]|nr:hypothetical protein [Anaerolineae bacterium]
MDTKIPPATQRSAIKFVILLGVVSLFADMTYEGARSISGPYLALLGAGGMGAQESIMRAAVGGMVAPDKRGSAYGVFNAGFGLAWFTGSVIMGALYDVSIASLVAFPVIFQLAAIPVLYRLRTDAGV